MTEQGRRQGRRAAGAAYELRPRERGAALATSLILLVLMGVVAASIMTVATAEVGVAGSDLQRMRTQKAAEAALEHMTNNVSDMFNRTTEPTTGQLANVAANEPPGLAAEGFAFDQRIELDCTKLTAAECGRTDPWPRIVIGNDSPAFAGLYASYAPYKMRATALFESTGAEATMEREINSFMMPVFQFGVFSNDDLELMPDTPFQFNGRVHANGNLYVNGSVLFANKVTTGEELVTDLLRNSKTRNGSQVKIKVGNTTTNVTAGSAVQGPFFSGSQQGRRGFFPGSPSGSASTTWDTNSVLPPAGNQNRFGGQLLTRSTGAKPLRLAVQLGNVPARELIKRRMPNDSATLSESRYHTKAQVRILIDNEDVYTDASGIPAGKGVELGEPTTASPYYFKPMLLGGGRALWRVDNAGTYLTNTTSNVRQGTTTGPNADAVRNVRNPVTPDVSAGGVKIPGGAGVRGRVLVEVVRPDGTAVDVTRHILSMGMTVGEPNAIVCFQRPLWAAFTQYERDRSAAGNDLRSVLQLSNNAADGEIRTANGAGGVPQVDNSGYLKLIQEDDIGGQPPFRGDAPPPFDAASNDPTVWNSIVPINLYNVREGWIRASLSPTTVYRRGVTSVVEINMHNLVRWLDGVYDNNLLANTPAASTNIGSAGGYVLYVSDRRGDQLKSERDYASATLSTTNGMNDNEDIYGPNNTLDAGEDVIDSGVVLPSGQPKKGTLQTDANEISPLTDILGVVSPTNINARTTRARLVSGFNNITQFRRGVRLFRGENLRTTGASGKLSATKGLTVATENMLYVVGNYNTMGINAAPSNGTISLNEASAASHFVGNQVPASLVADAVFPLSKTWFDALPALFPEGGTARAADASLPGVTDETSVRAAVIAGTNMSALAGSPDAGNALADSRLSGGLSAFPRFLEDWTVGNRRWNYTGSLVPLFYSTQALGPWSLQTARVVYGPPVLNWSHDTTFNTPATLPPGTPIFHYVEPTAFRLVVNR